MVSQDVIESDAEIDDDDLSVESDASCIHGYKSEEDTSKQLSQPERSILTPLEATAELSRFRPIRATPSDLEHLLKSKADPNLPLKVGDISPLRKVMSFAKEKYVSEMRSLLLEHDMVQWRVIQIVRGGIYVNVLM